MIPKPKTKVQVGSFSGMASGGEETVVSANEEEIITNEGAYKRQKHDTYSFWLHSKYPNYYILTNP